MAKETTQITLHVHKAVKAEIEEQAKELMMSGKRATPHSVGSDKVTEIFYPRPEIAEKYDFFLSKK